MVAMDVREAVEAEEERGWVEGSVGSDSSGSGGTEYDLSNDAPPG